LTTVIGIKTLAPSDGLVLCSDSQLGSGDLVDLEGTKLFKLNDYAAIGCAGDIAEAQMLIEELQIELKDELLDRRELRKRVENVLLKFYNEYAVGWSKRLGIWPRIVNFYNPISLLAVRLPQNRFALYRLTLTSKPSMAEINNYEAIGTGDKLSNLVLRQYRRSLFAMTKKTSQN